jgi:hypothetical protein
MKSFSFFLLLLTFSLFSYSVFTFLSFDEEQIAQQVIPAPEARFIERSREELDLLLGRLQDLQELPEIFFADLDTSQFGRKKLFLPDVTKKRLGTSSATSL